MNEPVTVVVPTHQRPDTLRDTLTSVSRQRDVDLQIVVVDDADDDRTQRVVAEVVGPSCMLVANNGSGGAASSRNVGVRHAAGDWVAFCDDDDVWAPDKLRRQLDEVERQGADWSCTGAATVGPDLSLIGHERLDTGEQRTMREWNVVPGGGSSVLARTELVRTVGGFDTDLTNMEDWDLWIRLADAGPVAYVDRPLVGYRLWPMSKSANVSGMRRSARQILERHGNWPPSERTAYDLEWYAMWKMTNAGQRRAAGSALRLAVEHRSAKCAVRSVGLLASPALVRAHDRRKRERSIPDEWRLLIDEWLPRLREELIGS